MFEQFRPLFVLRVQYFTTGRCFNTTIEYVLVATLTLNPALDFQVVHCLDIFIFAGYTLATVDYRPASCLCVALFQVRLDSESEQRKVVCFFKFLVQQRKLTTPGLIFLLSINHSLFTKWLHSNMNEKSNRNILIGSFKTIVTPGECS